MTQNKDQNQGRKKTSQQPTRQASAQATNTQPHTTRQQQTPPPVQHVVQQRQQVQSAIELAKQMKPPPMTAGPHIPVPGGFSQSEYSGYNYRKVVIHNPTQQHQPYTGPQKERELKAKLANSPNKNAPAYKAVQQSFQRMHDSQKANEDDQIVAGHRNEAWETMKLSMANKAHILDSQVEVAQDPHNIRRADLLTQVSNQKPRLTEIKTSGLDKRGEEQVQGLLLADYKIEQNRYKPFQTGGVDLALGDSSQNVLKPKDFTAGSLDRLDKVAKQEGKTLRVRTVTMAEGIFIPVKDLKERHRRRARKAKPKNEE